MAEHTALIVGATGLVGKHLVNYLLTKDYYKKIKVLSRRQLDIIDDRLEVIIIDDFDKLEAHTTQLHAEDYYCTLGTTIKNAGSKPDFEKVDLIYPLKLAGIAKATDEFRQFLVVTAAGSNSKSPLFYNKIKGRLEDELKNMDLPALKIFRPSLLLGKRDELRIGEQVAKICTMILSFFMVGSHKALLSIHASDVAKAMFFVATQKQPGLEVYKSSKIYKLAKTSGN